MGLLYGTYSKIEGNFLSLSVGFSYRSGVRHVRETTVASWECFPFSCPRNKTWEVRTFDTWGIPVEAQWLGLTSTLGIGLTGYAILGPEPTGGVLLCLQLGKLR